MALKRGKFHPLEHQAFLAGGLRYRRVLSSIFVTCLANRQTENRRDHKADETGAFMILYGLKNCDSCKEALAQLRAAGREVAFVDIRTEPLDATQLADLLAHHGADILLNRKSTTWRNLDETARSLPPQILLAQHPTLIKRPIIFTETGSFVSWSREVQTACGL